MKLSKEQINKLVGVDIGGKGGKDSILAEALGHKRESSKFYDAVSETGEVVEYKKQQSSQFLDPYKFSLMTSEEKKIKILFFMHDGNFIKEIYQTNYWNKIKGNDIDNQSIALIIYDGAVNQGRGAMRSVVGNSLRRLDISIENDNVFSAYGINLINEQDPETLFELIKEERIQRYKGGSPEFIPGHLDRVSKISYSFFGSLMPTNYTLPLIAVGVGVLSIIIVLLLDEKKQENYIRYEN